MAEPGLGTAAAGALLCRVGGASLALPAAQVAELVRPRPFTRVPHAPAALLGVMNLRGQVLPVLSLALLRGEAAEPPGPAARVVVLARQPPLGLLVAGVTALGAAPGVPILDIEALLAGLPQGAAPLRAAMAPAAVAAPAGKVALRALVVFGIAGQEYALPLDQVAQVAPPPRQVAALPGADPAMLGSVAWRGGLLPLVSLRVLLGLAAAAPAAAARVVVARLGAGLVGLLVDDLRAILRVPEAALDPVPALLTRGQGEARVAAICRLEDGRRLVSVLAAEALFRDGTLARLGAVAEREEQPMSGSRQGDSAQYLVFRLGEEQYGLPLAAVDEVVRHPGTLARLPRAPGFVAGLLSLRGRAVPVVDQRQRFAVPGAPPPRGRRIIVVTLGEVQVGFAVDSVTEVLALPDAALQPAPALAGEAGGVSHVASPAGDDRMVLLVQPQALLDRVERDLLAALAAAP